MAKRRQAQYSGIGGQAVLEGVMMKNRTRYAVAVRKPDGDIDVQVEEYPGICGDRQFAKLPLIRGVFAFIDSLVLGMRVTMHSASFYEEEEAQPEEAAKKTSGGRADDIMMGITVALSVVIAVALFMLLPFLISDLLGRYIRNASLVAILEGILRILIFVGYIAAISLMKDIRRLYMYHGAEHKTIACYESEMPLTVENVQKCSRYHDRCGTSFLVFVVVLSCVIMMIFDIICAACNVTVFLGKGWKAVLLRTLIHIAFLPFIAGISYEMLMLLANTNFVLFRPLKWLGKQFQKLTTREPDDGMCEVAITSFNAVLQMDADESIEEVKFPAPLSLEEFKQKLADSNLAELAGIKNDDWFLAAVLRVPQEKLAKVTAIPYGFVIRLDKMKERLSNGEPWQYVLGRVEFYGRTYEIDSNVLIPRQETELVTEQLVKRLNKKSTVLDLCCGSGVIGITAALETGATVTLADVSKDALQVAKNNAQRNKAKVDFIQSDMFANMCGKCSAIVCNPPYVETDVIETLDSSVKDYEPHLALDGGKDGLDFYRILADKAIKHLAKKGLLVLEIGYNQGDAVKNLLESKFDVEVIKDYGGNDRIVIATVKNLKKK